MLRLPLTVNCTMLNSSPSPTTHICSISVQVITSSRTPRYVLSSLSATWYCSGTSLHDWPGRRPGSRWRGWWLLSGWRKPFSWWIWTLHDNFTYATSNQCRLTSENKIKNYLDSTMSCILMLASHLQYAAQLTGFKTKMPRDVFWHRKFIEY